VKLLRIILTKYVRQPCGCEAVERASQRRTLKIERFLDTSFDNRTNDNDYVKRLGLTYSKGRPARSQKYNTPKIKMDNEAVQKLQTS